MNLSSGASETIPINLTLNKAPKSDRKNVAYSDQFKKTTFFKKYFILPKH